MTVLGISIQEQNVDTIAGAADSNEDQRLLMFGRLIAELLVVLVGVVLFTVVVVVFLVGGCRQYRGWPSLPTARFCLVGGETVTVTVA